MGPRGVKGPALKPVYWLAGGGVKWLKTRDKNKSFEMIETSQLAIALMPKESKKLNPGPFEKGLMFLTSQKKGRLHWQ